MTTSGNREQHDYWNGEGGLHWVAEADRYDTLNQRFGDRVIEALELHDGENVLEVGCGSGALAIEAATRVAPTGTVLGLDLSGPMLGLARDRAGQRGLANVSFEQADAQSHPLPAASFDAVFSRFGVMFFSDPVAAFRNIARATKAHGRLVFACWQDITKNDWLMVPAGAALAHVPFPDLGEPGAPGPFSLAEPERIKEVLGAAGWNAITLDDLEEPMELGTSLDDALRFMRGTDLAATLMADVEPSVAAAAWDAIAKALEPHAGPEGVVLEGRAWLVRADRADTSSSTT